MNTWNVMDAIKGGLILAGILLISGTVMADETDVIADRLDDRGDRIEERLDRRGDRIDHRLDKRGDRIDDRLDNKGDHRACQITVLQANLTIIGIRTDSLSTAKRAARCTSRHRKLVRIYGVET